MIKFKCSQCGEELEAPASMSGEHLQCPACRYPEIIPEAEPEPEPIKIELEDDDFESTDDDPMGTAQIHAFSTAAMAQSNYEFKRPLIKTGQGATRVKMFHARLSENAINYLEEKINEWIDNNPDIEVKYTNTIVGEVEGKKTEAHLIITVWY